LYFYKIEEKTKEKNIKIKMKDFRKETTETLWICVDSKFILIQEIQFHTGNKKIIHRVD